MKHAVFRLFEGADPPAIGERFEDLLRVGNVRIERIVSSDKADDLLYVQPQDEWVVLLRGEAELWVEGTTVALGPGDAVFLPARCPHRVTKTATGCVWLAVHVEPTGPA